MNQKLERFYKAVVEEALLGKDPDVAEDFHSGTFSTDKIARERQRQEIGGALRLRIRLSSSSYFSSFQKLEFLLHRVHGEECARDPLCNHLCLLQHHLALGL